MGFRGIFTLLLWFLILVLGIGGIGLSIGGIGDLFTDCRDNQEDDDCDDLFRSVWWAVFFGVATMLLTVLTAIMGQLTKTRTLLLVVSFVVLSTVDLMDATELLLQWNDVSFQNTFNGDEDSLRIGIAGLLAMSVANWLVIIVSTLFMTGDTANAGKGAEGAAPLT